MRLLGKEIQEIGRVLEKFLGKDNLGKGFPLHLQFDSLGWVVNSSNSRCVRQVGELKQKISIEDPKDVVHENPYAALEHALTSFMTSVALKEQVHP